jgi:hypothetical protein
LFAKVVGLVELVVERGNEDGAWEVDMDSDAVDAVNTVGVGVSVLVVETLLGAAVALGGEVQYKRLSWG